jgi:hypothetical protein
MRLTDQSSTGLSDNIQICNKQKNSVFGLERETGKCSEGLFPCMYDAGGVVCELQVAAPLLSTEKSQQGRLVIKRGY